MPFKMVPSHLFLALAVLLPQVVAHVPHVPPINVSPGLNYSNPSRPDVNCDDVRTGLARSCYAEINETEFFVNWNMSFRPELCSPSQLWSNCFLNYAYADPEAYHFEGFDISRYNCTKIGWQFFHQWLSAPVDRLQGLDFPRVLRCLEYLQRTALHLRLVPGDQCYVLTAGHFGCTAKIRAVSRGHNPWTEKDTFAISPSTEDYSQIRRHAQVRPRSNSYIASTYHSTTACFSRWESCWRLEDSRCLGLRAAPTDETGGSAADGHEQLRSVLGYGARRSVFWQLSAFGGTVARGYGNAVTVP